MTSRSELLMDELHEIRPGVHKRLGDCTARELKGEIGVLEERIEHAEAIQGLLDRLVANAEAKGVSHVLLPGCMHGARPDADLPALREQRVALEACVQELLG